MAMPTMMTNDTARISAAVVSECRANGTTVAIAVIGRRVAAIVRIAAVAVAYALGAKPPMTAAPMRPPAIPGPQPPRHRASAGDGEARAVTPTMPAAINANAVLFMIVPFLFFTTNLNGRRQAWFRYPISPKRAVSNLILVNG